MFPNPNLTIVTGFFDIGRDKWTIKHSRSKEKYLVYIKNMMSMDVNMIVFAEKDNMSTFREFRKNKKTYFVESSLQELEMYDCIDRMRYCQTNMRIMDKHPDPTCPEYRFPEYNVIMNSKLGMVEKAINLNPFNTTFFCWMDAGYTHDTKDLTNKKYSPTILYNFPYTVTISQLIPTMYMRRGYRDFFIQHIDVISGGFIFGQKDTLLKFVKIYNNFYRKILFDYGISDDDQYYMALLLRERPTLFNPIFMDWFGSLDLS